MTMIQRLLPEDLRPYAPELTAFVRELPRLVADGAEWKFVILKGDNVSDPWDTYPDAMEAAYDRHGLEPFLVQKIDPRLGPLLAEALGKLRTEPSEVA